MAWPSSCPGGLHGVLGEGHDGLVDVYTDPSVRHGKVTISECNEG
jgi:hypothetical protein